VLYKKHQKVKLFKKAKKKAQSESKIEKNTFIFVRQFQTEILIRFSKVIIESKSVT
jgi:hypothetical protein